MFVCIRSAADTGSAAGLRNKEAAIQGIPDVDTAFPNFGDTGRVPLAPFQVGTANPTVSAWKWVESGDVLPANCIPKTGSGKKTYFFSVMTHSPLTSE